MPPLRSRVGDFARVFEKVDGVGDDHALDHARQLGVLGSGIHPAQVLAADERARRDMEGPELVDGISGN